MKDRIFKEECFLFNELVSLRIVWNLRGLEVMQRRTDRTDLVYDSAVAPKACLISCSYQDYSY